MKAIILALLLAAPAAAVPPLPSSLSENPPDMRTLEAIVRDHGGDPRVLREELRVFARRMRRAAAFERAGAHRAAAAERARAAR